MKLHYLVGPFLVLASVGAVCFNQLAHGTVEAQLASGRAYDYTYFTNQKFTGFANAGQMLEYPDLRNVTDVNSFVSTIDSFLNNPSCCGRTRPAVTSESSTAYIIDMMLGKKGDDFGGSRAAGIQYAKDHFAEWETLVRYYDSKGWVNFNDTYMYCPPFDHYNTDLVLGEVFAYHVTSGACDSDHAATFANPDGTNFIIMTHCGNSHGQQAPLQPPPVPSTPPSGEVYGPTPGDLTATPPIPKGYNAGSIHTYSSCKTIAGNATDPNDATYGVPITLTFTSGAANLGSANAVAATSAPYEWSVATPAAVQSSATAVSVTATGVGKDGKTFTLTNSPISIGPCVIANVSCGAMTVTPSAIDPGTPFTLDTTVKYGSLLEAQTAKAQADFKYFITITGPGGYNFSTNVVPAGPDPATFVFTGSVARPATAVAGNFVVGWGVTGSFGAVNCGAAIAGNPNPPSFNVVNIPYFKVTGGDVSAGAGIGLGGASCPVGADPSASVVGWNRGSADGYAGAGTQYAVLALNHLQDFASGQGSGTEPTGLTFANDNTPSGTIDTGGGLYGGKFNSIPCSADYFANAPAAHTVGDAKLSDLLGVAAGSTYNVPNGTTKNLYVEGKVLVDVNVAFSGSYADARAIPVFSLVVKGNMYIAQATTRLDGFYIAQPTNAAATNGIIYSCAPSGFSTASVNVLDRNLQNNCGQQLVINGAVAARQLWLLRTYGTLSTPNPAEVINYLPEMWLSAAYGNGLGTADTNNYDSLSNPAPTL